MVLIMYAIRDVKTECFLPPMYSHNDGSAMRDLHIAITSGALRTVKQFPQDYRLMRVGTFDEESGVVTGVPVTFIQEVDVIMQAYEAKQDE